MQIISSVASKGESAPKWVQALSSLLNPNGWVYNILLVVLIVFFAYFYTQVTLNPTEIAKQIRENGGSIPGISADISWYEIHVETNIEQTGIPWIIVPCINCCNSYSNPDYL